MPIRDPRCSHLKASHLGNMGSGRVRYGPARADSRDPFRGGPPAVVSRGGAAALLCLGGVRVRGRLRATGEVA